MVSSFLVLSFACLGFVLASFIRYKKTHKTEVLVCPLKGKCHEVIHSEYSRMIGIPVECLGMIYYALIAFGYGYLIFLGQDGSVLSHMLFYLSAFAFCFSLYLSFIQVILLRKLCTWCLLSALFCLFIFLIVLFQVRL